MNEDKVTERELFSPIVDDFVERSIFGHGVAYLTRKGQRFRYGQTATFVFVVILGYYYFDVILDLSFRNRLN